VIKGVLCAVGSLRVPLFTSLRKSQKLQHSIPENTRLAEILKRDFYPRFTAILSREEKSPEKRAIFLPKNRFYLPQRRRTFIQLYNFKLRLKRFILKSRQRVPLNNQQRLNVNSVIILFLQKN